MLHCEKAAKKITPRKLPPTEDSFHQHVLRTIYQLMMWRQASSTDLQMPDPVLYGYYRDVSNLLCPVMMPQSPAAPELLNDLICQCKENSCSTNCTCLKNNQPCTSACICEAHLPGNKSDSGNICTNSLTLPTLVSEDRDSDFED